MKTQTETELEQANEAIDALRRRIFALEQVVTTEKDKSKDLEKRLHQFVDVRLARSANGNHFNVVRMYIDVDTDAAGFAGEVVFEEAMRQLLERLPALARG